MWPGRPMISAYRALVTVLVHLWIHFVVFVGSCPSRFFVGRFSRPFGFCRPGSSGGRLWVAWQLVKWGLAADWCFVSSFFSDSQHVPATPVVDQEPLSLQSSRIRGCASAGLQGFKHDQEHLLYFGCHAVIICSNMFHGSCVCRMACTWYILICILLGHLGGKRDDLGCFYGCPKSKVKKSPEILFAAHISSRLFWPYLWDTNHDYIWRNHDSVGQPSGFVIHGFDQNRNPEKFNAEKTRSKQKLGELQWLRMKSSVFVEVPL